MPAPQLTWQELLQHIADREREAESARQVALREYGNPYWGVDDIEQLLIEISQQIARETATTPDALSAFGDGVVQSVSMLPGAALPLGLIAIVSATITLNGGDTVSYPATRVSVAQWYQTLQAPKQQLLVYAIVGGTIQFKGDAINLTMVVEPDPIMLQANQQTISAAGFDEARVDWVHQMLQVEDFLQGGRI